jgi:uncharacterized protein YjcR
MSKAARIRELYAQGYETREIADLVGCSPEYVRVAGRQRRDGKSVAQIAYEASHPDYIERRNGWWQATPERRAAHRARCRDYYWAHKQKSQQAPAG